MSKAYISSAELKFKQEQVRAQILEVNGAKFEIDESGHVIGVLLGPSFCNQNAEILNAFAALRRVFVIGFNNLRSGFTSHGVSLINDQNRIEEFSCRYSKQIGDSGSALIARWPNIQVLCLASCGLSDRGVLNLATSTSIQRLDLSGNQISDESLEPLLGMRSLQKLIMLDTNISPNGHQLIKDRGLN